MRLFLWFSNTMQLTYTWGWKSLFYLPWKTMGARTNLSWVSLFSGCKVWHCCDCVACIMSIHLCLLWLVWSKPWRWLFLVSTAVGWWLKRTKRTNSWIPNCFFIRLYLNVWNFFFIVLIPTQVAFCLAGIFDSPSSAKILSSSSTLQLSSFPKID